MTGERIDARFVIHPVGPADADALARVHVTTWRETYGGLLPATYLARMSEAQHALRFAQLLTKPSADDVTLAVADRRGLVGYAQGGKSRRKVVGEAEVSTLYLLRSTQGRGLGRRLLADAARALSAQGASSLAISVLRDNLGARRFYEHLGGVAEPERREPGPGGLTYVEVAYTWADIRQVFSGAS